MSLALWGGRSPGAGGFTLLELLVVLTLVGVGASLSVASLDRQQHRVEARRWADRTEAAVVDMRQRAQQLGQPVLATWEAPALVGRPSAEGQPPKEWLRLPPDWGLRRVVGGPAVDATGLPVRLGFLPDGSGLALQFELFGPQGRVQGFEVRGLTGEIRRLESGAG